MVVSNHPRIKRKIPQYFFCCPTEGSCKSITADAKPIIRHNIFKNQLQRSRYYTKSLDILTSNSACSEFKTMTANGAGGAYAMSSAARSHGDRLHPWCHTTAESFHSRPAKLANLLCQLFCGLQVRGRFLNAFRLMDRTNKLYQNLGLPATVNRGPYWL